MNSQFVTDITCQAKDRFLAVLSHELRTPLTPALLLTQALLEQPNIDTSIQDDIEQIHQSIQLEVKLIDDLLDITRIINDKLVLNSQYIDLQQLLRSTLKLLHQEIQSHAITIQLELE